MESSMQSCRVDLEGELESEKREEHGEGTHKRREEVWGGLPVMPTWATWGLVLGTACLYGIGRSGVVPETSERKKQKHLALGETRGRLLQGSGKLF